MVDYEVFQILLVEDSATSAAMATHWLESSLGTKFVLQTVAHLSTALEILGKGTVDLTILDLNLPDSDGLNTFRAIRSHSENVPIVVLSGDSDEDLAVEAVRLGAQDYVVKNSGVSNPLARSVRFAWERAQRQRAEAALRANEQKLLVARSVQQYLLPDSPPSLPGYDIACRCEPAELVGGDYYDFIPMPCGDLGVAIADVSGHGMAAAMMMIEVRAILRALARQRLRASSILESANELVTADLDHRFITAIFGELQLKSRQFRYASAGHPALLIHASGNFRHLDSSAMPLGVHIGPMEFSEDVFLTDGDLLVLYTDGLVESMNPDNNIFGTERFVESLQTHRLRTAEEIVARVFQTVRDFSGGIAQADDKTLVVIKVGT